MSHNRSIIDFISTRHYAIAYQVYRVYYDSARLGNFYDEKKHAGYDHKEYYFLKKDDAATIHAELKKQLTALREQKNGRQTARKALIIPDTTTKANNAFHWVLSNQLFDPSQQNEALDVYPTDIESVLHEGRLIYNDVKKVKQYAAEESKKVHEIVATTLSAYGPEDGDPFATQEKCDTDLLDALKTPNAKHQTPLHLLYQDFDPQKAALVEQRLSAIEAEKLVPLVASVDDDDNTILDYLLLHSQTSAAHIENFIKAYQKSAFREIIYRINSKGNMPFHTLIMAWGACEPYLSVLITHTKDEPSSQLNAFLHRNHEGQDVLMLAVKIWAKKESKIDLIKTVIATLDALTKALPPSAEEEGEDEEKEGITIRQSEPGENELLTYKETSFSRTDKKGWNPLHYACQLGYGEVVTLLLENIRPELQRQAAMAYTPDTKETALHLAVKHGDIQMVRTVLQVLGPAEASKIYLKEIKTFSKLAAESKQFSIPQFENEISKATSLMHMYDYLKERSREWNWGCLTNRAQDFENRLDDFVAHLKVKSNPQRRNEAAALKDFSSKPYRVLGWLGVKSSERYHTRKNALIQAQLSKEDYEAFIALLKKQNQCAVAQSIMQKLGHEAEPGVKAGIGRRS